MIRGVKFNYTTRPNLLTAFASRLTAGDSCPTLKIGKSRQKRPGCYSIGDTIPFRAFAPFSARLKR